MDESAIRLNLGCGHKPLAGFVNVDLPDNWAGTEPDVEHDITKPLPFPDGHADEIHAYHVIEHFERWQAPDILADWLRVLKPGGRLVLELPCLDKIARNFAHSLIEGQGWQMRTTVLGLFGDPRHRNPAMMHRWCWSAHELLDSLSAIGYQNPIALEPETHIPARDMRVEAWRPPIQP